MEGCELLEVYEAGNLDPDQIDDFLEHLDECSDCQQKWDGSGGGLPTDDDEPVDLQALPETKIEELQEANLALPAADVLAYTLEPLIETYSRKVTDFNRRMLRIEQFVRRLDEEREKFVEKLEALRLAQELIVKHADLLDSENGDSFADQPIGDVALHVLNVTRNRMSSRDIAEYLSRHANKGFKGQDPGRLTGRIGRGLAHLAESGKVVRSKAADGSLVWRAAAAK